MSQRDQILALLKRGRRITPLKALQLFGCLSLSQRCGELRRAGYPVQSQMIELANGKRVASYRLARD